MVCSFFAQGKVTFQKSPCSRLARGWWGTEQVGGLLVSTALLLPYKNMT